MTACTVADCTRARKYRALCGTHYERQRTTGTVDIRVRAARVCTVDGCGQRVLARELCSVHYGRVRRTGTTEAPEQPIAERLGAGVVVNDGCWIWQGRPGVNGYGRISVSNRVEYVHRVSYETFVGPIPADLTIDHLCRVRMCINPAHLEPVTLAENTRRELQVRYA